MKKKCSEELKAALDGIAALPSSRFGKWNPSEGGTRAELEKSSDELREKVKAEAPIWERVARQAPPEGIVTVTTDEDGNAVAVTMQDEEHRILSVIWERETPPAQEDEPVAESFAKSLVGLCPVCKNDAGFWGRAASRQTTALRIEKAQNDKLRKVAEEAARQLEGLSGWPKLREIGKNLRAALERGK